MKHRSIPGSFKHMSDLEHMLLLTDRILMHLDHEVPPETEVVRELKEVMKKVRQDYGLLNSVSRTFRCKT